MHLSNIVRYALWCGIVTTANANRRHYRMATTWVPHLLMNTLTLLLPDLYRALTPGTPGQVTPAQAASGDTTVVAGWPTIHTMLTAMVRDNPRYVAYVAPLAAGYLVSHPRFNIYKGEWGKKEFAGLGLDALPHSTTAFALTALVHDSVRTAMPTAPGPYALARLLRWSKRQPALVSALVLALVTVGWEFGEYRVYRHELAQRGTRSAINMQWSRRDMIQDCVANAIGWGLALVYDWSTTDA